MRFSPEQQADRPPCTPTRRQEAFLVRNKVHPGREIDFYEAAHVIGRFVGARRELPPTARQVKFLKGRGRWRDGLSRGEAFDLIGRILAGMNDNVQNHAHIGEGRIQPWQELWLW
jgi:hypothetical protein